MLFTLLLFSEICAHSMALPLAGAGNYDDDRTDLESLNALLEDNKLPAGAGVQNLGGFTNRLDEGRPRIIIVSVSVLSKLVEVKNVCAQFGDHNDQLGLFYIIWK